MGTATLILGESGTGKSTSMRNINPEETILIRPVGKPLPFRSRQWIKFDSEKKIGTVISTDKSEKIAGIIKHAKAINKNIVIIDDFQYVMSNEFMRRSDEKSFDKFTEIGRHAWDIIKAAQDAPDDLRVYFMAHTEETQMGRVKMKTIGRMLDEKITVEGMFTVVLRTLTRDDQFFFTTKNNGADTVKSPMGMFDTNEIDNDLAFVDKTICEYWGINNVHHIKESAA
ncbi:MULTISPECIES: ATP-binding protein [unclassified Tatumella]|uniref:ATP-binding protein n=1 Tax=unclassified Tatumella TaxID=2649542 RepID=UPI001BAF1A54|nr:MULTISPECIES: ATP-binding protein [unclassified Tatumella]MBS0856262.1 AAA family ATPase [Tatumella sp. JGM16]MBS0913429.1 AAA family ATPase [Tatumella sp. JGM91]